MKHAHPGSEGKNKGLVQNADAKFCQNSFVLTTSTSTLMMHLKEKHDITEDNLNELSAKSKKIIDGWNSSNEKEFTNCEKFCITWATCGMSYSLVEVSKP